MRNHKGEIATLLTLGLVVVGTLITLGTSLFVSNRKTNIASNPKAAISCKAGECAGKYSCYTQGKGAGGYVCCSGLWKAGTSCSSIPAQPTAGATLPDCGMNLALAKLECGVGYYTGVGCKLNTYKCKSDVNPPPAASTPTPQAAASCKSGSYMALADCENACGPGNCQSCRISTTTKYECKVGANPPPNLKSCVKPRTYASLINCKNENGQGANCTQCLVETMVRYEFGGLGPTQGAFPAPTECRKINKTEAGSCSLIPNMHYVIKSPSYYCCPTGVNPPAGGGANAIRTCLSGVFQFCTFGNNDTQTGPAVCSGLTEMNIKGCKPVTNGACTSFTTNHQCVAADNTSGRECAWDGIKCIDESAPAGGGNSCTNMQVTCPSNRSIKGKRNFWKSIDKKNCEAPQSTNACYGYDENNCVRDSWGTMLDRLCGGVLTSGGNPPANGAPAAKIINCALTYCPGNTSISYFRRVRTNEYFINEGLCKTPNVNGGPKVIIEQQVCKNTNQTGSVPVVNNIVAPAIALTLPSNLNLNNLGMGQQNQFIIKVPVAVSCKLIIGVDYSCQKNYPGYIPDITNLKKGAIPTRCCPTVVSDALNTTQPFQ